MDQMQSRPFLDQHLESYCRLGALAFSFGPPPQPFATVPIAQPLTKPAPPKPIPTLVKREPAAAKLAAVHVTGRRRCSPRLALRRRPESNRVPPPHPGARTCCRG